jgi:nitrate reductase cytochrome c-type subunit
MRKTLLLSALLASLLSLSAFAVQDQSIPDDSLGAVENQRIRRCPSPAVFEYGNADVGSVGKRSERSYMTAPPMIPHTIQSTWCRSSWTSIYASDCHVQPDLIKQKLTKGTPVPAPVSHYVDVKARELYMGRWNCTNAMRRRPR